MADLPGLWLPMALVVLAFGLVSIWQYGQALKKQGHQQSVAADILKTSEELQRRSWDLLERQETILARIEILVQRFEANDSAKQAIREERGVR
jgi:hypothetical protein